MSLPPSDFAAMFRALIVPRLRPMIEARGLFLALELEGFSEARGAIIREAGRLGAYNLPSEHLVALEDWIGSEILAAFDRQSITPSDKVWRDVQAWNASVMEAFSDR